jgi:epoxyqueuosine reductase
LHANNPAALDWHHLAKTIKTWALELGFSQCGIADTDLTLEEPRFQAWLDAGYHGEMAYMANHGMMRCRPAELQPGTLRVISVRLDYLPQAAGFATNLAAPDQAYISRYALGRDYHKLMRNKLQQLATKIQSCVGEFGFRPFVDSAPVLERPLAAKAGLGWIGKHSLLLNAQAGSWFFLGELLVDLPLPVDEPVKQDCGSCVACITMCPTGAIVEPYVVDARKCISYLTIEHQGDIPEDLRAKIGNRIYGCDDCQLVCPVNRQAPLTEQADFQRRAQWRDQSLLALFKWDEATFLKQTEGSAIRRIGHQRWQRNIAVALGNAPYQNEIVEVLQDYLAAKTAEYSQVNSTAAAVHSSADPALLTQSELGMVMRHVVWALEQQQQKAKAQQEQNRQQQRLIRIIQVGLSRDA